MEKQNAISSLKESIRLLEIKQAEEGAVLKEQFAVTLESLKPINLLKTTIKEMTNAVDLRSNLSETVISILAGYLTKKVMVNSKSGPFIKILGAVLQFGTTSLIAQNADNIREFINRMIDRFLRTGPEEVPETEI